MFSTNSNFVEAKMLKMSLEKKGALESASNTKSLSSYLKHIADSPGCGRWW